jgi:hypothetical protein
MDEEVKENNRASSPAPSTNTSASAYSSKSEEYEQRYGLRVSEGLSWKQIVAKVKNMLKRQRAKERAEAKRIEDSANEADLPAQLTQQQKKEARREGRKEKKLRRAHRLAEQKRAQENQDIFSKLLTSSSTPFKNVRKGKHALVSWRISSKKSVKNVKRAIRQEPQSWFNLDSKGLKLMTPTQQIKIKVRRAHLA